MKNFKSDMYVPTVTYNWVNDMENSDMKSLINNYKEGEYIHNSIVVEGNLIFQLFVRKHKNDIVVETEFMNAKGEILKFEKDKIIKDSYEYSNDEVTFKVTVHKGVNPN